MCRILRWRFSVGEVVGANGGGQNARGVEEAVQGGGGGGGGGVWGSGGVGRRRGERSQGGATRGVSGVEEG